MPIYLTEGQNRVTTKIEMQHYASAGGVSGQSEFFYHGESESLNCSKFTNHLRRASIDFGIATNPSN